MMRKDSKTQLNRCASSEFYYNDLLHQNVANSSDKQDEEEKDNQIVISDDGQSNRGCFHRIKSFVNSDKFIFVSAKLVVLLTGMVGPLLLFIKKSEEGGDNNNNQTFFGFQQITQNDFPFQKTFFRYLILVVFLYFKTKREEQPKNSRDFISSPISTTQSLREGAFFGLLDFIQVQSFIFSLGYTSILRAYLFGGIQLAILLLLKRREGIQIYTSEKIAFLMGLTAQIYIVVTRVDSLNHEESFIYGDLVSLFGGVVGSLAYFQTNFKMKNYYHSLYVNNQFSLGYAFVCVLMFDTSGFMLNFTDFTNIALIFAIGVIDCIVNIKKIKAFIFMKYLKNIFEPFIGFKFEYLFGLIFLDTWSILIIFIVLYIPANIIVMKKHSDDIRNNVRQRDSTFIDILNFQEYIEMKEIQSPERTTENYHNIKS